MKPAGGVIDIDAIGDVGALARRRAGHRCAAGARAADVMSVSSAVRAEQDRLG